MERQHRTLKKIDLENSTHWEDDLPFVLFCLRDVSSASTGFSPFELVFDHAVRGPLCLALEKGKVYLSVL